MGTRSNDQALKARLLLTIGGVLMAASVNVAVLGMATLAVLRLEPHRPGWQIAAVFAVLAAVVYLLGVAGAGIRRAVGVLWRNRRS
jgi:hypothetical protein